MLNAFSKNEKYRVMVMDGFMTETESGYEVPGIEEIRTFEKYAPAKAFYRSVLKEGKKAVHFFRGEDLVTFKEA